MLPVPPECGPPRRAHRPMEPLTLIDDAHPLPRPHFGRPRSSAYLEVLRGRVRRRLRPIQGPVFLAGADFDCHLVLADRRFPARHHLLLAAEQSLWLVHLGAGPEIVVEGEAISWRPMEHGDTFATGDFAFRLHLAPSPEPLESDVPPAHNLAESAPPRLLRLLEELRAAVALASRAG